MIYPDIVDHLVRWRPSSQVSPFPGRYSRSVKALLELRRSALNTFRLKDRLRKLPFQNQRAEIFVIHITWIMNFELNSQIYQNFYYRKRIPSGGKWLSPFPAPPVSDISENILTRDGRRNYQRLLKIPGHHSSKNFRIFNSYLSPLITWIIINLLFWPLWTTVNTVLSTELSVWRNPRVLHTLAMWMYETLCSEAFFWIRTFSGFMSRCAI